MIYERRLILISNARVFVPGGSLWRTMQASGECPFFRRINRYSKLDLFFEPIFGQAMVDSFTHDLGLRLMEGIRLQAPTRLS